VIVPRLALFVLAALFLVVGCPSRKEPEELGPRVVPGVTRDATQGALDQRLEAAAAAFESGDASALEATLAVGSDAISLADEGAAAQVAGLLSEQGHHDQALDFVAEARQTFPPQQGYKALCFPEARALEGQGKVTEAAQAFEAALRISPTNPFEYSGAADLWTAADGFDRAQEIVDAGLGFFPGDPILLQARAEVALRRGDAATAMGQLDALRGQFPDEVGVRVLRMEALVVAGRYEDAREAALSFERDLPILSHGTVILGLAEARLGHAAVAEQAWVRAEGAIEECTVCAGDEAALLIWAREQASAETIVPQDR
jgi:tetratricopeptide (TPR) repeat protein